ncbi:MAG: glycosyltransferase family 2 protein [Acidobacteria bacterium]|nr:glycosyltransferase family 2 protein [Acidobacteriota bacterium]
MQECLSSLLRSRLDCVEVIVVDDASTDHTLQIASRFAAESRPAGSLEIKVISRKNRGGAAASRNTGTASARHPYILFLDADVALPENAICGIRQKLDLYRHRSDVAGVLGVYSTELHWKNFVTDYKNLYTRFLYDVTETQSPFVHTPIFCVRRYVLVAAGGFQVGSQTAEDFQLGVRLGSRGYKFVIHRRLEAVHLKRYDWWGLLKEDWRRIRDLKRIRVTRSERVFYYQAHRWSRLLSLFIPGPVILFLGVSLFDPSWFRHAMALLGLFLALNLRLLAHFRRYRGWRFFATAALFLFVEMLWAELALLVALVTCHRNPKALKRPLPEQ